MTIAEGRCVLLADGTPAKVMGETRNGKIACVITKLTIKDHEVIGNTIEMVEVDEAELEEMPLHPIELMYLGGDEEWD